MYNYTVVNKDAKRKKRKSLWRKIAFTIAVIVTISVLLALWIYWKSMTPTILDVAVTRLKSETARVINEAVCLAITNECNYADFVTIEKNSNNDITMITANSSLVNSLARNTALLSQSKINDLTSFDVNVPFGTLSGIPLLSEKRTQNKYRSYARRHGKLHIYFDVRNRRDKSNVTPYLS